jgi:ATP-binding cassette, subfamily B, bacterial PglK
MKKIFFRLWRQLERRRKKSFFLLLFLMFISSLAELLSLAMLIPFMSIVLSPDKFKENEYIEYIFNYLNIHAGDNFLLYITLLFIATTLVSGIVRYYLLIFNAKFTFSTSSELAVKMYKKVLYQPFEKHANLSSSLIINGVTHKVNSSIYSGVLPFLTFVTSIIVSLSIIIFLLYVNTKVVIISLVTFGTVYFLIALFLKKRIHVLSKILPEKSTLALKAIQEGLGNIKDVIIDKAQTVYIEKFSKLDMAYKNAARDSMVYGGSPKIIIEVVLIVSIAYVLFYLSASKANLIELIPIFTIFIFSAQRLLPLIHSIYSSYVSMMSARHSMSDVLSLLEIDLPLEIQNNKKPYFNECLKLNNISFSYDQTKKNVIENLDLIIKKGDKLGIIGKTGSGKSTLVDMLMGLLTPKKGDFFIDETNVDFANISSWQNNIAHVPQSIYLSDSTIYENIGFGIDYKAIEKEKVKNIIKKVGLEKVVNELADGLDTIVGERGSKLSGGQRQRIGIARALYKNANVLFLDEATSALDNETEKSIMKVINNLENITIIMIAHRISTLSICNRIIELDKGKIVKECLYSELVKG